MNGAAMHTYSPAAGAPPAPLSVTPPKSQHASPLLPSPLSLGLLPSPPPSSSSRPPSDHHQAIGAEPIASARPAAAAEHERPPVQTVRLSDIAPYEGAPCGAYVRAVEVLSGSLTRHNAVVIEMGGEGSAMVRCALESARMFFKAKAQCGGVDTWRKSNRGVHMYRAGGLELVF